METDDAITAILNGRGEMLELTEELVRKYNLEKWSQGFSLMTAGYRDRLDPDDAANPNVPFNVVTVALLAEARARVFDKTVTPGQTVHVHVGGETRAHTQTFIQIASRVFAAHQFKVHLRKTLSTTPIWYTSFGTFFTECDGGDNFTASHSQYFKGGWKPVDPWGQQLLKEEPEIQAALKDIVANRHGVKLSPWPSPLVAEDFDVDAPYVNFQRSVVGDSLIAALGAAGNHGFRTQICTMGGSMKRTSERLFKALGVSTAAGGIVSYYNSEEDSRYHNIGEVNGEDIGVDPSKPAIYRKLKAQEKLLSGEADIVLFWDPDGDRLNVVTKAPIYEKDSIVAAGMEVDEAYIKPGSKECIVYFTPNQLYLMLAAFRITKLRQENRLADRDWFVGITYPTSQAFVELANAEGLRCVRVPVGFRYLGSLCSAIEAQLGRDETVFETSIGQRVPMGRNPRALILAEESGGATLGGYDLLQSRSHARTMLALREKDAMQLGLLSLCLAATLQKSGVSFARHYCELLEAKMIKFRHYSRSDVHLYDESKMGADLQAAKLEGFRTRDRIMQFFGQLADDHKNGRLTIEAVRQAIQERLPAGTPPFPAFREMHRIGEDLLLHGCIFEGQTFRFLVRASGTDALLRYYVEATEKPMAQTLQKLLTQIKVG